MYRNGDSKWGANPLAAVNWPVEPSFSSHPGVGFPRLLGFSAAQ